MAELDATIWNTSYDEDLLKIKNFKLHEELLPFIGCNYEKYRLLLVGESHYIKRENLSEDEIINIYKEWYNKPTNANEHALEYKAWFTTRNIIKGFQRGYRSKAHTMFSNPGKAMVEVLGNKCPTDSAAFSLVAFCNYFQRPNLEEGKSMKLLYPNEARITAEIFEKIVDIIKPKGIIFLSKKAYDTYMSYKSKEYSIPIDFVHHPTSPWWYKDKGKEKFIKIMEAFFPRIALKEEILDERILLMKRLFNDIEKAAVNRGYNYKTCPYEFVCDYYIKGRDPLKLPYIIISKGNKEAKIEIDSRIYVWKNDRKWEYLSIDNKRTNKEKRTDTPNFLRSNEVHINLFDEDFRKKFVNLSLDYIATIID